jgi:hypothetical protein
MGKIRTQDVMTAQRNTNMCRRGERLFIRSRNDTSISVMRVTYQTVEDVFVARGKPFEVPNNTFIAEDEEHAKDMDEMMAENEREVSAILAADDVKEEEAAMLAEERKWETPHE